MPALICAPPPMLKLAPARAARSEPTPPEVKAEAFNPAVVDAPAPPVVEMPANAPDDADTPAELRALNRVPDPPAFHVADAAPVRPPAAKPAEARALTPPPISRVAPPVARRLASPFADASARAADGSPPRVATERALSDEPVGTSDPPRPVVVVGVLASCGSGGPCSDIARLSV